MESATARSVLLGAALVSLFTLTTLAAGIYHSTQRRRGDDLYRAGLELARAGDSAAAADDFRAALTYNHNNMEYRLALARSLLDLGRLSEAGSHLEELQRADPTGGEVNRMLARLAARQHDADSAIDSYRRAVYGYWDGDTQQRIRTHFELADFLFTAGRNKQGIAELIEMASEPGLDDAARTRVAGLLLAHGAPDHAAEVYADMTAQHPRNEDAWAGLGQARFALGDFLGARTAFRSALRLDPRTPDLVRRLAWANTALELDPSQVHISANERFRRVQALIDRVAENLATCAGGADRLSGSSAAAINAAHELKAARRQEGDTPQAIALLQQLWAESARVCGPGRTRDPVVSSIVAKLQ